MRGEACLNSPRRCQSAGARSISSLTEPQWHRARVAAAAARRAPRAGRVECRAVNGYQISIEGAKRATEAMEGKVQGPWVLDVE